MSFQIKIKKLEADIVILGGGAAGLAACHYFSDHPSLRIILLDKVPIARSGCLAAGVNAINAWIDKDHTPQDYVEYAFQDAHGIASRKLLLNMAKGLNQAVEFLERLGLTIQKGPDGHYLARSWRNVKINGENIKPLLAQKPSNQAGLRIITQVHPLAYLFSDTAPQRLAGVVALNKVVPELLVIHAPAVICATGGVAGIYRPNHPGPNRHKIWYPPFNTGGGLALGILSGAEMTTLEMRFVALRCEGTQAPTGTLALGGGAQQINSLGEAFESRYGKSTSERVYAARAESLLGRGPIRLETGNSDPLFREKMIRAYFHMAPLQSLKWLDESYAEGHTLRTLNAEISGSEPFVQGGHTAGGYYVQEDRKTTLPGLWAAGDVAGGSPQKYVSGAIVEGWLAAESVWNYLLRLEKIPQYEISFSAFQDLIFSYFSKGSDCDSLEEESQLCMDELAGGQSAQYRYSESGLKEASQKIQGLLHRTKELGCQTLREFSRIWELKERLIVARSLIAHLLARKETRWRGFGEFVDYPEPDQRFNLFVNSRFKAKPFNFEEGDLEILYRDLETGDILPCPEK
ncbi:MAG: adenylyl-sulfate reductase subunit alpha [Deltaproteobacteria bacterium]|nr:adenylyl-sulfate reductase subunit alpha [Deltaproteobacteria bacterium]